MPNSVAPIEAPAEPRRIFEKDGYLEVMKFSGFERLIRNTAFHLNLNLELKVIKYIVRERMEWTVRGSEFSIGLFEAHLMAAAIRYNNIGKE